MPRELSRKKPLARAGPYGTPAAVSVIRHERNISEDHVQPLGLAVGKGADQQRHPILEAGGREGGDDGLAGDGFLDEVVLAAEVGVEEGEAADGLVVAGVEDACDEGEYECKSVSEKRGQRTLEGEEFVVELVAGVEFEELVGGDDEGVCGGVFRDLDVLVLAYISNEMVE